MGLFWGAVALEKKKVLALCCGVFPNRAKSTPIYALSLHVACCDTVDFQVFASVRVGRELYLVFCTYPGVLAHNNFPHTTKCTKLLLFTFFIAITKSTFPASHNSYSSLT